MSKWSEHMTSHELLWLGAQHLAPTLLWETNESRTYKREHTRIEADSSQAINRLKLKESEHTQTQFEGVDGNVRPTNSTKHAKYEHENTWTECHHAQAVKCLSQNGYRLKPKSRNVNIHKFCEYAYKRQTRKHDKSWEMHITRRAAQLLFVL